MSGEVSTSLSHLVLRRHLLREHCGPCQQRALPTRQKYRLRQDTLTPGVKTKYRRAIHMLVPTCGMGATASRAPWVLNFERAFKLHTHAASLPPNSSEPMAPRKPVRAGSGSIHCATRMLFWVAPPAMYCT